MNTKIPITIAGNLVADPELTIGDSGTPHAKLRVAVNQRIQNPDGTWRDGEPVFHNVSAFRMLAENAATSLKKGDPVTVAGELEFRSYDKDGERREARRIIADTIGPDLRFGTATYQRAARAVAEPEAQVEAIGPEATTATGWPVFNVTTKSPVVTPPFAGAPETEMTL